MRAYDPHQTPDPEKWLGLDEAERHALVEAHHRLAKVELPNATLHAVIHTVVENQLAMGIPEVRSALERLIGEGLDRHDALHAIGSLLAERMYEVLEGSAKGLEPNQAYLLKLEQLTAEKWRDSL